MIDECEAVGGVKIGRENRSSRRNATLSTTNPTWRYLGSNSGRHGGKPATNRLSYGTAYCRPKYCSQFLDCYGGTVRTTEEQDLFCFIRFSFRP
jgi:hypothetical protein